MPEYQDSLADKVFTQASEEVQRAQEEHISLSSEREIPTLDYEQHELPSETKRYVLLQEEYQKLNAIWTLEHVARAYEDTSLAYNQATKENHGGLVLIFFKYVRILKPTDALKRFTKIFRSDGTLVKETDYQITKTMADAAIDVLRDDLIEGRSDENATRRAIRDLADIKYIGIYDSLGEKVRNELDQSCVDKNFIAKSTIWVQRDLERGQKSGFFALDAIEELWALKNSGLWSKIPQSVKSELNALCTETLVQSAADWGRASFSRGRYSPQSATDAFRVLSMFNLLEPWFKELSEVAETTAVQERSRRDVVKPLPSVPPAKNF